MKFLIPGLLLCALCAPVVAQDEAPPAKEAAAPKVPDVKAGELRLDGKIKAILNAGIWQMEALSWTSPRQVTTDFAEPKSKTINVAESAYIHPLGEPGKIALGEVKLGARIAVIGKNNADGSLSAREVVLLEGYGSRKTIGTVSTNPFTLALVRQSRKAREEGNLPQALKYIESAITAAQGINDASGEGLATQDKTLLLFDMDEVEKAGQSAARVESLGRATSNPLLISMGMNGQARALAATGELEKATQILEAADPISAGSEPAIHLSILGSLAEVYGQAGRTKDEIAVLQRIFPLEESLRQRDDATGTLLSLAQALAPTQPDQARDYLKQATPRVADAADEKIRAQLNVLAGNANWQLGDKDAARANFEAAAKLLEDAGNLKAAASVRAIPAKLEAGKKPGADTKEETVPDEKLSGLNARR